MRFSTSVDQRLIPHVGLDGRSHAGQQLLDLLVAGVEVEQRADDWRSGLAVHALHVRLDEHEHVLLVQVVGELLHVVEAVAHVDERARVLEVLLQQELLHLLGVVVVVVAAHALHLLQLVELGGGLDVLEHHVVRLSVVDERAEVVEDAVVRLEVLEQADELLCSQVVVPLLGHLHHQSDVLHHVVLEQVAHAVEAVLWRHAAEVLQQEVRVDELSVGQHALDVHQVRVVLQGALVQLGALAQLGDLEAVVVGEAVLLALHDGVGHLRGGEQVDLQQASLQRAVLLQVTARLQVLEQDVGGGLDVALVHERVHSLEDVQLGALRGAG